MNKTLKIIIIIILILAGIAIGVALLLDRVTGRTEEYLVAQAYCDDENVSAVHIRSDGTIKITENPRGSIIKFLSPDGSNPLCEADDTYDVSEECAAFLLTDEGWKEVCVNDGG